MNYRIIATLDAASFEGTTTTNPMQILIRTTSGQGRGNHALSFTGQGNTADHFARRVCNGPVLSGPYLSAYGTGTVLSSGPIQAKAPELHLIDGDVIEVTELVKRGQLRRYHFRVTIKGGYPKFECIAGFEQRMGDQRPLDIEPVEISADEYSAKLREAFEAKHG